MGKYSIGVDLGGTNLRVAAVSERGEMLEKVSLNTGVSRGRDHVVKDMCDGIQGMVNKHRGSGSLCGIGIGVPGIIDMEAGMVRESPNLPDWADYPVRDEIEKRLGTRVILENDANSAAFGEQWLGAARHVQDMAMLTLGTGVGGGLVFGGKIWHGMTGMAGELGHMTVDASGPLCGCGNHGCLEPQASATGIVRMAHEAIAAGNASGLARLASSDAGLSAKSIYELATQGDEDARKIYHGVGRAVGIVLSDLVNALNLPIYVIGGGVSAAWDAFAPAIFEELQWRSLVYAATSPEASQQKGASAKVKPDGVHKTVITRSELGSEAGLFGAARLPLANSC